LLFSLSSFAVELSNQYLQIDVSTRGGFQIKNKIGSDQFQSDDNANITFPKETSAASVIVDGKAYFYGDPKGSFTKS